MKEPTTTVYRFRFDARDGGRQVAYFTTLLSALEFAIGKTVDGMSSKLSHIKAVDRVPCDTARLLQDRCFPVC